MRAHELQSWLGPRNGLEFQDVLVILYILRITAWCHREVSGGTARPHSLKGVRSFYPRSL